MEGIHHIHKRKRKHHKLLQYPHPNKWVKLLDRFLLVVAVVGPLLVLPQILKIYVGQNATGVSALSWGLLALFNIPWILYGAVHGDKPITMGYSIWFVVNIIVAVGALIY
jgi:uncharacterized protein with PQ loop repeat